MKGQFQFDIPCDEAKIQDTIAASKAAFLAGESEKMVFHAEFLYYQSKFIKKRWWVLQGLLLAFVCFLLCRMETDYLIRRSLGLAGPLFVILILPELWKNRNFDAMEVECTTFFTLRSIYAARLTLFAGVDILLLSVFFAGASLFAKLTLWEILIQFVLPFNVTCCICFWTLYSKHIRSEAFALLLCILWTAAWSMLILNNAVYRVISTPVWITALALSFVGLAYTLCRGQERWQQILEVKPLWI